MSTEIGQIRMFAFNFAPGPDYERKNKGWALCDGRLLKISEHESLAKLLGKTYGGDGVETFGLPDLRGRAPVHQGGGVAAGARSGLLKRSPIAITEATSTAPIKITTATAHGFLDQQMVTITGVLGNIAANGVSRITLVDATHFTLNGRSGEIDAKTTPEAPGIIPGNAAYISGGTVDEWQPQVAPPYLGVNYSICLDGDEVGGGDEPYLGEISMFAGTFAPRNWAFCGGQILALAQNTALFSLLGTQYGGDAQVTFALPDLRGAMPVGVKQAADPGKLPAVAMGGKGASAPVQKGAVQVAYLPINFIIALAGRFPSRS